jgi:hypothetical protein
VQLILTGVNADVLGYSNYRRKDVFYENNVKQKALIVVRD